MKNLQNKPGPARYSGEYHTPGPKTQLLYPNAFPVNARELYNAAKIGSEFSTWFAARLRSHAFEPGCNYVVEKIWSGKSHCERTEYFITIEAAFAIAKGMCGESRKARARAYLDALMDQTIRSIRASENST